jgi:hypothetical protein
MSLDSTVESFGWGRKPADSDDDDEKEEEEEEDGDSWKVADSYLQENMN